MLNHITEVFSLVAKFDVKNDSDLTAATASHHGAMANALDKVRKVHLTNVTLLSETKRLPVSELRETVDELVHDFGNALAPVGNAMHLMNMGLGIEKNTMLTAMIRRGLEKAEALLKDRVLPALSEKGIAPAKANINLGEVLASVSVVYRLGEPTITVEIPTEPLVMTANDLDLFTAISNLCKNAQEAIIEKQAGKGKINVRAYRSGGYVVIEVKDNGPGIPHSLQTTILQRDGSTKGKGRGIGLSSVQRMIDDHNGEFGFDTSTDAEKHGTTFYLRFPNPRPK